MSVESSAHARTAVRLPADVTRPFEVYLNSVQQHEGTDYAVEDGRLVFETELRSEGRLGFWRWLSISLGIAGTYRQNDTVDVVYVRGGKNVVASKLPIESPGEPT
jgi:hypothetical protein